MKEEVSCRHSPSAFSDVFFHAFLCILFQIYLSCHYSMYIICWKIHSRQPIEVPRQETSDQMKKCELRATQSRIDVGGRPRISSTSFVGMDISFHADRVPITTRRNQRETPGNGVSNNFSTGESTIATCSPTRRDIKRGISSIVKQ